MVAVNIRAEVTAQADDAILHSGKYELFVQIKLDSNRKKKSQY